MVVSQDAINAVIAAVKARYPAFNYESAYTLQVSGAIASSTGTSTYANATVTAPDGGTNVPTNITSAQWWIVSDEHIDSTSTINQNASIKFTKNGQKVLGVTSGILGQLTSSTTRSGIGSKPFVFEPQSSLTISQAPTATSGTVGPYTNTFNIDVTILDSSYSNQLSL